MFSELQFVNRFEAWNAYEWLFNDSQAVRTGVLPMFPAEQQDLLIGDNMFGMGKIEGLTVWFQAANGGQESFAYITLLVYFNKIGVPLNFQTMNQIIGPTSLIKQISNLLTYNIQNSTEYNQNSTIDNRQMVQF